MNNGKYTKEEIQSHYPYDHWSSIDEARSIQFSQWCCECLAEKKYLEAQVTYRGSSLCLDHFKIKIQEDS
jgi:hypothetical protein